MPEPLGRTQRQAEAPRVANASVVVFEVRIDDLNLVSDAVIVGN